MFQACDLIVKFAGSMTDILYFNELTNLAFAADLFSFPLHVMSVDNMLALNNWLYVNRI